MGEGFDHLRCPMCGGELIYSEGTHDLCCARNPYESMSGEEWEAGAALHEGRAGYGEGAGKGEAGRLYIYKVWNEGEADIDVCRSFDAPRDRFARDETVDKIHPDPPLRKEGIEKEGDNMRPLAELSGASRVSGMRDAAPENGHVSREAAGQRRGFETNASSGDEAQAQDTHVKGHVREMTVHDHTGEVSAGEKDCAQASDTFVKRHPFFFSVSLQCQPSQSFIRR